MEIFAPTMHQATIHLILALAAIDDLHLHSVDISHAFINGDIDADVYMMQPEGFKELGSEYVCWLNKSIYGLKQAARLWNEQKDLSFTKEVHNGHLEVIWHGQL